jgi:hypothetical protein
MDNCLVDLCGLSSISWLCYPARLGDGAWFAKGGYVHLSKGTRTVAALSPDTVSGSGLLFDLLPHQDEAGGERSAVKEKLLFVMPYSWEEILYASGVMAQYLISRLVTGRNADEVVVVCLHKELHGYLRACWGLAEVVDEPTRQQIDEADVIFEFDAAKAYQITKAVEKPMAEAFSEMLGVGLMRFLPPVLVEDAKEEPGLVLVATRNLNDGVAPSWEWPHLTDFCNRLYELDIPAVWLPAEAGWDETRALVGRSSVVVGVRGSATLMAAAANRIVVELVPEEKAHKEWVRKKECATYRMLYGDLKNMTSIFVWAQIEKLISETKGKRLKMAVAVV